MMTNMKIGQHGSRKKSISCPGVEVNLQHSCPVNFTRYRYLHQQGYRSISHWFTRGWMCRSYEAHESFEPFMTTWMAFNCWAACVTGIDTDKQWIDALTKCPDLCAKFAELVSTKNSPVAIYAHEFQAMWPIFKAQQIRTRNIHAISTTSRSDVVQQYLNAGLTDFSPECWQIHQINGTVVPLDWPHTLVTLYRVRCNLFHGEKEPHSEMDWTIVARAFRVLVYFLHDGDYILPDM